MLYQLVQLFGSLLILAAFVAAQFKRIDADSYRYLIANVLGSAVLAGTAIVNREWGFILLEGVWAIVSLISLIRLAARSRSAVSEVGHE